MVDGQPIAHERQDFQAGKWCPRGSCNGKEETSLLSKINDGLLKTILRTDKIWSDIMDKTKDATKRIRQILRNDSSK